jgi:ABC-type antimicrobial peptide transport system permease subunit
MKNSTPPGLFLKFFRWYCHPKLVKHIEGDLMEVYHEQLKTKGKNKADIQFVIDVLLLFRPGIVRSASGYKNLNSYGMYKSYFKIGWRNLLRNKGYSIINIGGLAIGMTVAILNALWIEYEFSFNTYFSNYDNIAQVAEAGIDLENGEHWIGTTVTYPLATTLIDEHHQHFKRIVRTSFESDYVLSTKETLLSARGLYADEAAPEMFTFRMIQGTRAGLSEMHGILISSSLSKALFGTGDPINRSLKLNNKTDVTVKGVYEDFPHDTKFYGVQFFCSWNLFLAENKWIEERAMNDLRNHFIKAYVEIHPGSSFEVIQSKVKGALKFDPADVERATLEKKAFLLYPMSRWHLYPPEFRGRQFAPIEKIVSIGLLGLFVLLLACINFMNLSTARAERRAKEVGIRKTIGSIRTQLIQQFFSESFLVVSCAFLFALVLTSLFLPSFNAISEKQIEMPWNAIWFWSSSLGFVIVTSVLAGSYPALYLSSFNPAKVLKGTFRVGRFASTPRKILVVFQFCISVMLIAGTLIVNQQIQYAKNRPVGYDREGLIMIRKNTSDFYGKYAVLRNELKNTGAVSEVSESMGPVTETVSANNGWDWKGRDPNINESFVSLAVSHLHGKTAGWQFVKGRDFNPEIASDSSGLIINEAAARFMGLENPIGESVSWSWWADKRVMNYTILGVIKDMVMDSPYAPIEPTIFYVKGFNGTPNWINIRINPTSSMPEALSKIESVFKKNIPDVPFEYQFVDEAYGRKFASVELVSKLASIFASLAIFISCLGLLGLASFMAEQRTKEIGIRKVLGASVLGLWKMLSKDFVVLIGISCAIAGPLAYYFLARWLEKFEYRTEISWWVILVAGGSALAIALLTVSYQAIKAALMNPVKSLRSE